MVVFLRFSPSLSLSLSLFSVRVPFSVLVEEVGRTVWLTNPLQGEGTYIHQDITMDEIVNILYMRTVETVETVITALLPDPIPSFSMLHIEKTG